MNSDNLARLADLPLNFRQDQRANLDPQLRQLNLKLGLQSAVKMLLDPPASLLLMGAAGLLYKRRYGLAGLLLGGLVLQQARKRAAVPADVRESEARKRKEIEFERRALKAQRGDYGPLEVIAFR
jgi:hypothetical protein